MNETIKFEFLFSQSFQITIESKLGKVHIIILHSRKFDIINSFIQQQKYMYTIRTK